MISVILPAMNEELIVGTVIMEVRRVLDSLDFEYEVIMVDDGSTDNTSKAASDAGARVIRHAYNMGNGAAVKTGIRHARGDIVVLMDADGQHRPDDIPRILEEIPHYGMVVGARVRDSHASRSRVIANLVYNAFASYICSQPILDLTSGFRAIHTTLARHFLYLLPNTFSYPTTITLALIRAGHCVKYIPIRANKRVGISKIKLFRDGYRFFVIIIKIATVFSPLKVFLPVSFIVFATGVLWYLYTYFTVGRLPPASVIMILAGLQFFLMGLISEQIAQLRFDRSEDPSPYDPTVTELSMEYEERETMICNS
jgi:glycosyltransferase involved in cell wall biosynthesis